MKRIVIAGLLIVALTGAVIAETAPTPALALSGAIKFGVQIETDDQLKEDGVVTLRHDGDGVAGPRVELVGAYTNGDFGADFRLRSDSFDASGTAAAGSTTDKTVYVSYAYARGNLLNNMVSFKAGLVDDGQWAGQADAAYDMADGKGINIYIKPIKGLNFGAKIDLTDAKDTTGYTLEQLQNELGFGFAYDLDKMFSVRAGYKLDSDKDDTTVVGKEDTKSWAYGSFKFIGVPNLTAVVESKVGDIGDYKDEVGATGYTVINEGVKYVVNTMFTPGIYAFQTLYSNSDIDMKMKIRPYVDYKLNDKISGHVRAEYETQPDVATTIAIEPRVKFTFNAKSCIEGRYRYQSVESLLPAGITTNTNKINIFFTHSF